MWAYSQKSAGVTSTGCRQSRKSINRIPPAQRIEKALRGPGQSFSRVSVQAHDVPVPQTEDLRVLGVPMSIFVNLFTLFFFVLFARFSRVAIGKPDKACTVYIVLGLGLIPNLIWSPNPATILAVTGIIVVAVAGCIWAEKPGWASYPPHIVSLLFVILSLGLPFLPPQVSAMNGIGQFIFELAMVLAAYAGVGGDLSRTAFAGAVTRLGLDRKMTMKTVIAVVLTLVLLLAFNYVFVGAFHLTRMVRAGDSLVTPRFASPWLDFLLGILLAAAAALGEEILFRGALQPVYGIPLTSLVWASGHIQYGVMDPLTAVIFVDGLVWGMLRKRFGTRSSILGHFLLDAIVATGILFRGG